MRRWLLPAAIVVVIGGVVALVVAGSGDGSSSPAPTSSPAVNATIAPLLPTDALELPDTTADDLQRLLVQLHGTPVVLNVWGSWCGPCKEEGPILADAARKDGHRVQFLGLDVRDTRDGARDFIRRMKWTYPSLFDPSANGQVEIDLGFFSAVPITLFFDASGKRVDEVSGPLTEDTLAGGIRRALG